MTTAELKALLSRPSQTEREYRIAREKANACRQLLTGRAVRYDGDTSHNRYNNTTETALCLLADYETEADRLFAELVTVRKDTQRLIDSLSDTAQREVLTRRYIFRQKWEEIAEEMNYSRQHVTRIHGRALQKMCLNVTFFV